TQVRLLGLGDRPSGPAPHVVVALDTPYVLGDSRARTARIATYGETAGAMRALVSVLLGRTKAPGHLPVRVGGVARSGC
ncbi:MAG: glycoside hydrolase family 3, partial [Nocardioidaceae bacterium]|nr:glycoside hydrolase family 3 [Nocardioidaceae bacterium]